MALLVGLECLSQTQQHMKQNGVTIEVVKFKLKEGITHAQGERKLLQLDECIKHFEGFIERNLSSNEDGEWVDIVYWETLQQALAAAEQASKDPKALESFAVIDESTIVMQHYNLIHKFNN